MLRALEKPHTGRADTEEPHGCPSVPPSLTDPVLPVPHRGAGSCPPCPGAGVAAASPCRVYLSIRAEFPKAPWKIPALIRTARRVRSRRSAEEVALGSLLRFFPPPLLKRAGSGLG